MRLILSLPEIFFLHSGTKRFFYNFVIFQISIRPNCEIANNFIELLSPSLNYWNYFKGYKKSGDTNSMPRNFLASVLFKAMPQNFPGINCSPTNPYFRPIKFLSGPRGT